jgi:hypothetical protein
MELVAFGHAARDQYLQMDEDERVHYLLFERFKMSLFADGDCAPKSCEILVRATDGTPKPVKDVC